MGLMNQFEAFDSGTPSLLRPTIELHIDELVLDGFDMSSGARIGAAMQRELSRLIFAGDLAQLATNPLDIEALNAGSFYLERDARPNYIGRQLAQRVYGQLDGIQQPALAHNSAEGAKPSHA